MVRALVIGASGLVGGALLRALGADAVGTFRRREVAGLRALDARDPVALDRLVEETRPEVVYFPAAEPDVDWCETHPADAREANVAPALLSLATTRRRGARFVFFSSDYVFDGAAGPYGEDDAPRPLSVYGTQKREVEERVLEAGETVVRTTTVFGRETPPGKNFVLRLVRALRAGERVRVPLDQSSTPTWSDELARGAVAVAREGGVWHVAGPDVLTRVEFARLVAQVFALSDATIVPVPTSALAQPAARPLRGGLRTAKLARRVGRAPLPTRQALARLRQELAA